MGKILKKRNWAFVVYPESAPADWREQLQLSGVQVAISPLHDRDLNATGEPKKAHWHVIVVYGSPTTESNVMGLTGRLNAPKPIPLEQVRGYYRYLTHKDNPEKAQYDENDIQTLNGFDIRDFVELTKSEVLKIKEEIIKLINARDILEYADLIDYLHDFEMVSWFDVASSHTIFFNNYLMSRRCKRERSQGSAFKPTCVALDGAKATK